MARKQFTKLNLGPSKPITARNSTVGSVVIADYLDPVNNQRTLVLERTELAPAKPTKKKKATETDSATTS